MVHRRSANRRLTKAKARQAVWQCYFLCTKSREKLSSKTNAAVLGEAKTWLLVKLASLRIEGFMH
jgi:hypothetical protein